MSDNPTNVLLEQIIHQNQAVLEIVGEMQNNYQMYRNEMNLFK